MFHLPSHLVALEKRFLGICSCRHECPMPAPPSPQKGSAQQIWEFASLMKACTRQLRCAAPGHGPPAKGLAAMNPGWSLCCRGPSKATKSFSRVNTHPQVNHSYIGGACSVGAAPERRVHGGKERWAWAQATQVSDLALPFNSVALMSSSVKWEQH